ncbi:glycosyl hydrolase family 61-domain-containing protein [Triangularia setosa]|uniref:lytic cellulose monooxygenase (C4-dehydrogenating) n=1 Tax=Triangularia setosa TaxID=2587417 RepID=A0AAN6W7C8_9PEZI|nr:glycosyl hydrolase family 61-domain-containing protein [Podospora setosa]
MKLNLGSLALWALTAAPVAEAHYRFSKLLVNGKLSGDWEYMRENSNGIMPTKQFLKPSDDFRCNSGSFANAGKTKVAKVMPGDTIGFQLWYYATMQHPGPLTIHMSKAPGDVRNYRGDGDWFKVHQMIICKPPNQYLNDKDWCTWDLSTVQFTLPRDTPPGQYLVRVEHIALHGAQSGDTEFYFTCAQIEVGGNGNGRPGPMVKIPGLYDSNDPALRFFIYGVPSYPYTNVGKHAVWTGGNSGGSSPAPNPAPSNPPVTNPSPGGGGTAPLWGQCGGNGWAGPTRCAEGICKFSNDWYSQCVR